MPIWKRLPGFYRYVDMTLKIGNVTLTNRLVMAPMAGITNLPFRRLVRQFGAALAISEMVSAEGLRRGSRRSFAYLESARDDRPFGVQLFGAEPAVMAEAARIVTAAGADLVDINMGCPVRKVVKTGAGAALLTNPVLAGRIVSAVRGATSLPLSVKIRSGWDKGSINAGEMARIIEENGADVLTVHARTAKDGYSGRADWEVIARVKGQVKIPVIGNGDIRKGGDVLDMLRLTGCDGVMVGRGALGNPWIFQEAIHALREEIPPPVSYAERKRVVLLHYQLLVDYLGLEQARREFFKHLLWYTKGLPGGGEFRQKVTSQAKEIDIPKAISGFLGD